MADKKTDSKKTVSATPDAPKKSTAKPSDPAKATASTKSATPKKPTTKQTDTAKPAATAKATSPAKSTVKQATEPAKPTASKKTTEPVKDTAKATEPAKAAKKPTETATADTKPAKAEKAKSEKKNADRSNKSAKKEKSEGKKTDGEKKSFLSVFQNKKVRIITISVVSFVLIFALVLGLVLGLKGCDSDEPWLDDIDYYNTSLYATNTAVGFSGEVLGTVERHKPVKEVKDGGLSDYPVYGTPLSASDDVKNAIIRESSSLTATGTANAGGGGYIWMDQDGYLYNGTTSAPEATGRQLYQHTASVGLYRGNVSDDEPAIIKKVTMRPRGYSGYGVTGVYAPAGEVIKIQLTETDMAATGGIVIHIGQALYNGQANNIWAGKPMPRMPHLLNTMTVSTDTATFDETTGLWTAYVGSFLGGPLYIRNENVTFSATISGGVTYSHFILGYTTEKEFEENAKSSAPYFDLEVWNFGVLHSGPKVHAQKFSYDDLYKVAVLWDKVASVTTTGSSQGIVFLYDPFVAAGAAVAFPGRRSVNCPDGWMTSSLDYNSIVNSGSWGNFHEYHHNFQGYGVGNGGEVTNNGMTLVSYALFTKISATRGMSNYGAGSLGGWNAYTCATWALQDLLKIQNGQSPSNGNQGLAIYATLLHNFGPDAYIQAKVRQQSMGYGESYIGYMRAWQDVTHNDMTYFFKDVLQGIDGAKASEWSNSEYSKFVPVSCVYQTGRSYMDNGEKKYFKTMQPYVIPYGSEQIVDLRAYTTNNGQYSHGSIVMPDGFDYTIKNIVQPKNGKLVETDTPNVYKYIPDQNSKELRSGEIKVTLSITGSMKVDDVDLVLEFEQSHEMNKTTLNRTTYTYSADKMYQDAQTAFENNFNGYTSQVEQDHFNPTQNANTDIWFRPNTDDYHTKFPNDPDQYFVHDNTIEVIDGKLYFEEESKYRIYLRGRLNCAAYFSIDGKDYRLGAVIKDTTAPSNSHLFRPNDSNTYFDVEFGKDTCTVTVYVGGTEESFSYEYSGEKWLYVKEVLIVQSSPSVSYIGLGMKQWTTPIFTVVEKYYDKNGKEVSGPDAEGYVRTETKYYNYMGIEVSEEEAGDNTLVAPVISGSNDQPYVNAYRTSYEITDSVFETDYFYKRSYSYSYTDNHVVIGENQRAVEQQCDLGGNSLAGQWGSTDFNAMVDGDKSNSGRIHTQDRNLINSGHPITLTIDMGENVTVNRLIIYSTNRPNGDWYIPVDLTLKGSLDGMNYFVIREYTDLVRSGANIILDFDLTELRYYQFTVTKDCGHGLIINELEMWHVNEVNDGTLITPDDDMFTYEGRWHGKQINSTFGHVYVGEKGAKMSFEFTGTRVGILSSAAVGTSFEVYIDGKKIDSIALKADENPTSMTYLCDALAQGKHRVEVKCTDQANIDAIVIYP